MLSTDEKLRILADSAKYDVSCSSSGVDRKGTSTLGSASACGICHTWSADGRCVSLLKVLYSNDCAYNCEYCISRRDSDIERATFEPRELADLTVEFYRRNYIEGLFLSSAVLVSPEYTTERIIECLRMLRYEYGFGGYIHAKLIPGISRELVEEIGLLADRVSVNLELPTEKSLKLLAPQKKKQQIFLPMRQITNTLIERKSLKGPGNMFAGNDINSADNYIDTESGTEKIKTIAEKSPEYRGVQPSGESFAPAVRKKHKEVFAPAGQTTQMIIGATGETDLQIMKTTQDLYRVFKMKRVYYSAYIPVMESKLLPGKFTLPPLAREHRLYQADWLLRFYHFGVEELLDSENPNLDTDLDPKIIWALRHMEYFPMEVNKASYEELLRIPGIGNKSALRILKQRRFASVKFEDLRKIGVVVKRAKYFLTCSGRYYGDTNLYPENIRRKLTGLDNGEQLSMWGSEAFTALPNISLTGGH